MLPLDLAPEASASLLGYALRNGRASGYRSQYSCLEGRRVSLNTYARYEIGVPCGSCPHLNGFADRRRAARATGHGGAMDDFQNRCGGADKKVTRDQSAPVN